MFRDFVHIDFPQQRVSGNVKSKPDWYANCIDYVISAGIALNDRDETEKLINILHGNIPNEFYKKTLNPYNTDNERYLRFPATMRNLDIMSDIIRRYVSEYFKGIHEFVVGANNAEVILKRNAKLREEIGLMAQQAFKMEFERRLQELQKQAAESGNVGDVNPQEAMPNPEEFIRNFNEKYIDDESKQAQDLLDYIRSITQDSMIYLTAFFNYGAFGECYTYSDVRGEKLIKENVNVLEAYPIPNNNFFVEDHDMFARRMLMSYSQILDLFGQALEERDRQFLEKYYSSSTNSNSARLMYSQYFEYFPDQCEKFTKEERELFKKSPVQLCEDNTGLFEVWHVVWKGEAKRGVLTYVNEMGFVSTRIVDEDYKLDKEAGDIDIEWAYETQVYEGYRIGSRYNSIYPIKARPIAYQRDGKLPYNGIMEVLPLFGKFSIVKLITPYQIMRNIFTYHRELVIARNKMLVLLLPKSLVSSDSDDVVYNMASEGILLVDDEEDSNSQKMAQIRMLNANMGDYINQLTQLIESIKLEAREMVDMNMQRYGEIAQSAGAATTEKAVAQSSMGSVILVTVFDEFRKRDYQRDLDFAKLAYVDGLQVTYFDDTNTRRYLSLDVNSYINSDYGILAKNDQKEMDKIKQLKDWAFSAAQNGELDMALSAITGDNVTQIKSAIQRFTELRREHEKAMQESEQLLKQEELQNKLAEIQAKGEEDRKTKELEYQYEMQMKYIDVDMSLLNTSAIDTESANRIKEIAEQTKADIARQKLTLDREKFNGDMYNAAADREIKREQMATQLKIAQTNRNKYDSKKK